MVEANSFGGPKPTARVVGPSRELAADKRHSRRLDESAGSNLMEGSSRS